MTSGTIESPTPASEEEAKAALHPDRPEGAADDPSLAERLRKEAGLADDEAEARGELPGMPPRKLTLNAGGEEPSISAFKLDGRSIDLGAATQFDKGDTVYLRIGVRFYDVHFVDKHDKETGQVTDTTRRHVGKIVSYELEDVEE
jgi:hypothetical protein